MRLKIFNLSFAMGVNITKTEQVKIIGIKLQINFSESSIILKMISP